jgi:hypothetical protein
MDARVLALNADEKSLTAGEKLAAARHWRSLGAGDRALWGECLGSAVYQVVIDRMDSAYRCSCPSRKFPCKHVVGLLALHVREPDSFTVANEPEWVAGWLERRGARAEKAAEPTSSAASGPRSRRADERMQRVQDGVAGLELWLADVERDGLARLQTEPHHFWERQAARLVDAQAPGLAAQVRAMTAIPSSLPDWPERVSSRLGRLALLLHAFRRLDSLDPALQHDVRRLVGWSLASDEVTRLGEAVRDHWMLVGQVEEKEDRLITQRTWLVGQHTGRAALVLQFAPRHAASFAHVGAFGTIQEMELRFWPSAFPQRARIERRWGSAERNLHFPGHRAFEAFLASVAEGIARLPWLERSLCIVHGVRLARGADDAWHARDGAGNGLPLVAGDYWPLLAATAGRPFTIAGEWDGELLRPMGWAIAAREHEP